MALERHHNVDHLIFFPRPALTTGRYSKRESAHRATHDPSLSQQTAQKKCIYACAILVRLKASYSNQSRRLLRWHRIARSVWPVSSDGAERGLALAEGRARRGLVQQAQPDGRVEQLLARGAGEALC